jgi:indole-3-glycerol phosphate synthase
LHDLLTAIVACARTSAAHRQARVPRAELEARAAARAPRGADFVSRLGRSGTVNVIAECKRRSPAKGVLRGHYEPSGIATVYEHAGAAAISVLTEGAFFDGALEHLSAVRAAVSIPVIRKDFIVDEYQLWEARAFGADAALLIVAALDRRELTRLMAAAAGLGLAALVEVHDEDELARAIDAGASVIGVNCRNLRTLAVDTATFERLAPAMPRHVVAVAESGLRTPADVTRLAAAGYRGFLIGETLMTSPDPGARLRELTGAPV